MVENQIRLDKWLWYSRLYKSRSIAAQEIKRGKFRVNGVKVTKSSTLLKCGDILIFYLGKDLKGIRVVAISDRRGPSFEAQKMYRYLLKH